MSEKVKRGTSKAAARQRRILFADAYIQLGENGTKAYLAAGFSAKNDNVAAVEAHRLLKDPKIQALIETRRQKAREKFSLTTDRVIQELARVAYWNAKKLLNDDGSPKALHELDDDTAAGLTVEMSTKDGKPVLERIKSVKASEKNSALDKAAKHLRLYIEPPPPPPQTVEAVDIVDAARRMAFALAVAAESSAPKPKPRVKKRAAAAA